MMPLRIVYLLCFLFSAFVASGQRTTPNDSTQVRIEQNETNKKSSMGTVFEGTPGRAMLYSLIIPGAGQIYNGRWWKAPLVWAGEGAVLYYLLDQISTYDDLNSCYTSLVNNETNPQCGSINSVGTAFSARQSARSNVELAWVFMGLAHLLNAFEAFIDRHLMNFDTSEDLSYFRAVSQKQRLLELPSHTFFTLKIPLK